MYFITESCIALTRADAIDCHCSCQELPSITSVHREPSIVVLEVQEELSWL